MDSRRVGVRAKRRLAVVLAVFLVAPWIVDQFTTSLVASAIVAMCLAIVLVSWLAFANRRDRRRMLSTTNEPRVIDQ